MKKILLLPISALLLAGCQEAGTSLSSVATVQLAPRLANAKGQYPAQVDSVHVRLVVGGDTAVDAIYPWNRKQISGLAVATGAHFELLIQGKVADDPAACWRWSGTDTGTTNTEDEFVLADTVHVDTVGTPVLSAASGTYSSAISVKINQADASGVVHYTTNGTAPTGSSTTGQAVTVAAATSLRARAFRTLANNTVLCSPMVEGSYLVNPKAPAQPTVDTVTKTSWGGYTIRFTPPSGAVAQILTGNDVFFHAVKGDTFNVTASQKLRIRSQLQNDTLSSSDSLYTFEVRRQDGAVTPAVLFSQAGGTYHSSQTIALSCASPDAKITYTIGGVTATYSSPILISMETYKAKSVTITAWANSPAYSSASRESSLTLYLVP